MKKLLVSELIQAILNANENDITTSTELSTLVEFDDYSTIMVDRAVAIGESNKLCLTYEVELNENEQGKLECSTVDGNSENTYVYFDFPNTVFVYEDEEYEPEDLAKITGFKNLILETKLNNLNAETVNNLLKQILIDYAVSST